MKGRTRIESVSSRRPRAPLDVIGIGFGPANLALALCLEEQPPSIDGRTMQSLFLERKASYEWHPDMLLEGAEIQVPFLKDLVTLRNPQSHFTFLNYLRLHGRLLDFVNLRRWFPTRLEFNHYYRWVAAQGATTIPNTGASVTLATVNLSSGTYLINAKMWLSNTQTSKTHYVKCSLVAQDTASAIVDSDSTTVTVVSAVSGSIPGATALPFTIANTFPTAITVTLNCQRLDSNTGSTSALDIRLTAAQVTTIVTQ